MPQTLLCSRNHTVPFTDDDRGGEVYCPVCGIVCPVPAAEAEAEVAAAAQPLRCRNGHIVAFSEDDRGGEVYCRSCGVVCEVPAASTESPAGSTRRRATIFTAAGESQVAANVAGRVPCPRCEQPVPYTVADYGETVYCMKCGASVSVGESLQQSVAARAEPAPTGTTPVRTARSRRQVWFALGGVLFLMLAGGGVFVTREFPESMPFDTSVLPWSKTLVAENATPEPALPPPPPPPPPPPRPDLKIKPEMVERLLKRTDVKDALIDAQSWRDVLIQYKTPKADSRLVGIEKAIPELQKRLKEQRPTVAVAPSSADKCLDHLDAMQNAVRAKDIPAARKAGTEVDAMFKAHPDLVKRYSERYESLKSLLADLGKKPPPPSPTKTVRDVEQLLTAAMEQVQKNEVTVAMELRAKAIFLAPRVKIDGNEEKRLNQQIKDLTTAIHKARGLRDAADAQTCHAAGDAAAVKILVGDAQKDLPEFNDQACRKAFTQVTALSKKPILKPVDETELGKDAIFRHEYERTLDALRDGDKLVAAVDAGDRAQSLAPNEAARERVRELMFEGIEVWILTTSNEDGDAPRRAASRTSLDKARTWLGEARGKRLDVLIMATEAKSK